MHICIHNVCMFVKCAARYSSRLHHKGAFFGGRRLIVFGCSPDDVDGAGLLASLKEVWGYQGFRPGQETAVRRLMSGRSALLVSATGSGKSLCYLLPALKLPGLAIVVSPLIALITDQMAQLPACLPGAQIHSMMTQRELQQTISRIQVIRTSSNTLKCLDTSGGPYLRGSRGSRPSAPPLDVDAMWHATHNMHRRCVEM